MDLLKASLLITMALSSMIAVECLDTTHLRQKRSDYGFVEIDLSTKGDLVLTVHNVELDYGKWAASSTCDTFGPGPDGDTITSETPAQIVACQASSSGAVGSFDIYYKDEKVANAYFNVPWGAWSKDIFKLEKKGDGVECSTRNGLPADPVLINCWLTKPSIHYLDSEFQPLEEYGTKNE